MSDASNTGDDNTFQAEPAEPPRVVVLISGNGSNLQALIDAQSYDELGGEIVAVVSNKADAYGLKRARDAGIEAVALPHQEYESREAYDGALIKVIERHEPDLIALAGFMRILTPIFVQRFFGRLLNIHPSLLPAYQGLNTHARALADGAREHGASVHFVTEELDGGPVALQAVVNIAADDTEATLKEKVQAREHLIYPIAVRWFLEGRLQLVGDDVTFDDTPLPPTGLRLSHADAAEELDENDAT
ncbi:phosphoribosylglycinamide formyltransferase [Aidingimonas halophila]|uniref:Phosphoribosylglycinamide formyltransferase n=1 Tax=Aidingimonas halophila TaxID=574349 RepID=A0A1H3AZ48_9GAMM|nr:phosphoribosylglycinamide formyltransferase [Aidingimonas halophila]GHC25621.1 phosphoribosylglycinamide formyltransferase [Aidingimonas halophila]SDX35002.1 formyltetrahydrofolate-dependent phosphoribosylglycinamide formyltransferase [Aidingimonas halophila]